MSRKCTGFASNRVFGNILEFILSLCEPLSAANRATPLVSVPRTKLGPRLVRGTDIDLEVVDEITLYLYSIPYHNFDAQS